MPLDTSKTAPTPNAIVSAAPDRAVNGACADNEKLLADLDPIFDVQFGKHDHVVLAVSGGSDSIALMYLAISWRRRKGITGTRLPNFSVVTIDHGLRPESAAEAVTVSDVAAALGLPHTTLVWRDPKPKTGVQAAARAARRELLSAHLSHNNWRAVAMAHTIDDQAETLLMRLARGSGIDGLGAMRAVSKLAVGQSIVRPLLGTRKRMLMDYLVADGIGWIEDPTNQSRGFERVRTRDLIRAAADHEIGLETEALARSATRLARASDALASLTVRAWAERGSSAHFNRFGYATLRLNWLLEHPEEIRLRLLAGLLNVIGGQEAKVSLGKLETLTSALYLEPDCLAGKTFHGAKIDPMKPNGENGPELMITRETGRQLGAQTALSPGTSLLWDRRFRIAIDKKSPGGLVVGPTGKAGVDILLRAGWSIGGVPPDALQTQPALWILDGAGQAVLAAVPLAGYSRPELAGMVQCETVQPEFC